MAIFRYVIIGTYRCG